MERTESYNGFLQGIGSIKVHAGIEAILGFSAYNVLEFHPAEDIEDPPETLHMAWGLWLHHRDALHRLDQKYEIGHVLRNARAADDILHYLDYVPKIGHDEHKIEMHEINFDYYYSHGELTYNVEIKEEEDEEIGTSDDFELDEELEQELKPDGKHDDTENELENLSDEATSKRFFSIGLKKDLVEILRTSELEGLDFGLKSFFNP